MKTILDLNLKVMKKLGLLMLVAVVTLTACNEEMDETSLDSELTEAGVSDTEIAAVYEDVDDMVSLSLESTGEVLQGGRVAEGDEPDDDRFCENVVTFEGGRESGTITIDFGEGCVDRNGNVRKGKIVIVYTGPRFEPGSVVTTTLIEYSINDIALEGVRALENMSTTVEDYPTFHITLEGGKVIWPDETFATREVDKVRVWKRERNPREDSHLVTGEANGITRRGVAYEVEILDTLVYKRACIPSRRARIPVEGVKQITTDENIITVDFGDGACDRRFEISVDGVTGDATVD